jgi:hypothetical protein
MIEVIASCLIPMFLTTANLPEYRECVNTADKIEHVEEHALLVSEYFHEDDIPKALNIIYCESSGIAGAVGVNTNGSKDVGLWQFNDNTWDWLKPKLGIINPRTNTRTATYVAAWLVYNDGWHHWNSSKHCWKGITNERLHVQLLSKQKDA